MQVGDLVSYSYSEKWGKIYGIILDREYHCYDEPDTYKVFWFVDYDCDWWEASDLEVVSESR